MSRPSFLVLTADAAPPAGGGAALSAPGFYAEHVIGFGKQAETLSSTCRNLLDLADRPFGDITLLAAGAGPGSFTGARIGLSYLLGLRLALGVPLVAADGFVRAAFTASRAGLKGPYDVRIPAGRGALYRAVLDQHFLPLEPARVLSREEAAGAVTAGLRLIVACGAPESPALCAAPADVFRAPPRLRDLTEAVLALRGSRAVAENETIVPLYVRPPDALPPRPRAPGADAPLYFRTTG